ncbi:hypothetical protein FRB90_000886 [Tulasnella sp. 427]|nr:hypothetical protein FRB90_000886 [Tulasnella sp. 427]
MVLHKRENSLREKEQLEDRVMTPQICGLIDTCLEEGHYESAIDILEKSRTSSIYPAPYHIRVLLYLSLYPHGSSSHAPLDPPLTTVPLSPSKKERQRRNLLPSRVASQKATMVLQSLALSNSPKVLLKGLPAHGKRYFDSKWNFDPVPPGFPPPGAPDPERGPTGDTSAIVQEANRITEPREIWTCLTQSFIRKMDGGEAFDPEVDILALKKHEPDAASMFSTPQKGKGRSSKHQTKAKRHIKEEEEWGDEEEVANELDSQPVGANAWPALEWLVLVYEQDQNNHRSSKRGEYSPLLLDQLPLASPRKDISTPLKIVFSCFRDGLGLRFSLGLRILNLIINLSKGSPPNHLYPPECVRQINSAIVRYSVYDPDIRLPFDTLQNVFAGIKSADFRLGLCCLYLATRSNGGDPSKFLGGNNSSEPSRGGARSRREKRGSVAATTTSNGTAGEIAVKTYVPFPLPPVEDVLSVLALPPKLDFDDDLEVPLHFDDTDIESRLLVDHANAKLYVLTSIEKLKPYTLQNDWQDAIKIGRLRRAVEQGFAGARGAFNGGQIENEVRQKLKAVEDAAGVFLDLWEASLV